MLGVQQDRQLIQVSQNITNSGTMEREIRALFQAMALIDVNESLLFTAESGDTIQERCEKIKFESIASWLSEY